MVGTLHGLKDFAQSYVLIVVAQIIYKDLKTLTVYLNFSLRITVCGTTLMTWLMHTLVRTLN